MLGEGLAAALEAHPFLSGLSIARCGEEIFPPEDQIRLRAEGNAALGRYAALPSAARSRDRVVVLRLAGDLFAGVRDGPAP